jgi:hypothetical protein
MEWANYSVIVSNIGTVGTYKTKDEALHKFNSYVELSRQMYGRASNESVTLYNLDTQDIEIEYIPEIEGEDAE